MKNRIKKRQKTKQKSQSSVLRWAGQQWVATTIREQKKMQNAKYKIENKK